MCPSIFIDYEMSIMGCVQHINIRHYYILKNLFLIDNQTKLCRLFRLLCRLFVFIRCRLSSINYFLSICLMFAASCSAAQVCHPSAAQGKPSRFVELCDSDEPSVATMLPNVLLPVNPIKKVLPLLGAGLYNGLLTITGGWLLRTLLQ